MAAVDGFEFNRYLALLTNFANDELSALLFDVELMSVKPAAAAPPGATDKPAPAPTPK